MSEVWRSRALIDLSALRHNVSVARGFSGEARIFAVVKADAYGHGICNVVPAIHEQVDGFAVATIDEGIRCRGYASDSPIMVLSEFSSREQIDAFCQYQLQPVVHTEQQAQWIAEARHLPGRIWLKFDSGMNRLGIAPDQVPGLIDKLSDTIEIKDIGLMSHLASADDVECGQTEKQIKLINDCVDGHPGDISLANSAGVVSWPQTKFDVIRPGIMLYGISPTSGRSSSMLDLRPVMQLETNLIAIKNVAAGEAVGYGGSWIARQPTKIGVAGFGYADGYPRCIGNRGAVRIKGCRAPVIGKVSMDMMTLDLSACSDAQVGDTVQLWGPELAVENVADWAETIAYELLCGVSPRVPRIPVR